MNKDLTVGKTSKVLWEFTLPLFISVIFQQMYNMADSIVAGRYAGEDALAAVGASYPITMLFMAVAMGSNVGCTVIISQLFGAKRFKELKTAIYTSLIACLGFSIIITFLGLISADAMLRLIKTPANIFIDAGVYLKIYILGFTFLYLYNVCTGIFTALGDSKTPLYFLIGSSLGNIVLDIIFVKNFKMGVAGVAWATFIAQGISCILALVTVSLRIKNIKTDKKSELFSAKMFFNIMRVAIPSILQQSFVSVGNVFIQGLVNSYGSSVIAGYSVAIKLNTFAIMCLATVGNGVSSFTAQNIGANKEDRVREGFKEGMKMAAVISLMFTLLYAIRPEFAVGIFIKESGKALAEGNRFLNIVAPAYIIVGAKLATDGVFRGAGDMISFMIATFADLIIRVILAYVLSPLFGTTGIWANWPIGWFIGAAISIFFYKKGNWMRVRRI